MANTHSVNLESSSSQYLDITDASQTGLDLSSAFSFEMWVRFESLPASGSLMRLIDKDRTGGDSTRSYFFQVRNDAGTYKLQLFTAGTGTNSVDVSWSPSTDTWYHLAVTWDSGGGTGNVLFYVDGSQQGSAQDGLTESLNNNSNPFCIGRDQNGNDDFFDGDIDDVRIWSDVRTSGEISSNRNTELNGDETGLVAYWKFNNDLLDEHANGNDLTNNNSATFTTEVPFADADFSPKTIIF